ncbi:acyltransferase [Roseibium sp. HPY-6]|uniref:acyltransferase n=1 Tax=Roseibium sp. HPY-6 TaxID=3229852 RepID=UPI00338F93A4
MKKKQPGKLSRLLRLVVSSLDPRAYIHLFRMINYYNYSHVVPRRKLTLGPGAAISPDSVFSNPERITAGRNLRLGSRCHLWAGPAKGRIVMGDDVLLGPEVMVTAANYRFNDGQPVTQQHMDEADVVIGNDVWLGTRVVVLPGVTINEGAIVGAGAVVTKSIPAFAIATGVPAKVVGTRQLASPENASQNAGDSP